MEVPQQPPTRATDASLRSILRPDAFFTGERLGKAIDDEVAVEVGTVAAAVPQYASQTAVAPASHSASQLDGPAGSGSSQPASAVPSGIVASAPATSGSDLVLNIPGVGPKELSLHHVTVTSTFLALARLHTAAFKHATSIASRGVEPPGYQHFREPNYPSSDEDNPNKVRLNEHM